MKEGANKMDKDECMVVLMDECGQIANTLQRLTSADAGSATVAAATLLMVAEQRRAMGLAEGMGGEAIRALGEYISCRPDEPASLLEQFANIEEAVDFAIDNGGAVKVSLNGSSVIVWPSGQSALALNADPANVRLAVGEAEKAPAILPGAEKPRANGPVEPGGPVPTPNGC